MVFCFPFIFPGIGGTCESRSHSSHSSPEKHQLKGWKSNDTMGHSEHSASSEPVESNKGNFDGIIHIEKSLPSNTAQSGPTRPKEEAMHEATKPSDKHLPNNGNATPCSVKETKVETGKPPKPQAQKNQNTITSLPQMPYVSTTGNGPNGKTITGFLYRYTKSEVSIICVCHGSTFSPAEFVQHAGSTGVSHPLKHITVIPSPLG